MDDVLKLTIYHISKEEQSGAVKMHGDIEVMETLNYVYNEDTEQGIRGFYKD